MRLATILIAMFLTLSGAAVAGPQDDVDAARQRGDYATVLRLLRSLADQGSDMAREQLGLMYAGGEGVPQDYTQAVYWWRMAADHGDRSSQAFVGMMYDNGMGVKQDYAEALTWYRMAADRGEELGQFNLGVMYLKGHGVPQDYVQAHMWFNLAASSPYAPTKLLEQARENRDLVAAKMTPDQIAEAQRLAREWKPK